MTAIGLIFAIFVVLAVFCFLMAEIGVPPNQTRPVRIAAWAFLFIAAIIWAFVLRASGASGA